MGRFVMVRNTVCKKLSTELYTGVGIDPGKRKAPYL
jgi:hypothetical protein